VTFDGVDLSVTAPMGAEPGSALDFAVTYYEEILPDLYTVYTALFGIRETYTADILRYWTDFPGIDGIWTGLTEWTIYAARPTSGGATRQLVHPGVFVANVWTPEQVGQYFCYPSYRLDSEVGTPFDPLAINHAQATTSFLSNADDGELDINAYLQCVMGVGGSDAAEAVPPNIVNSFRVYVAQLCPLGVYEVPVFLNPLRFGGVSIDVEDSGFVNTAPQEYLVRVVIYDAEEQYPPDEVGGEPCTAPDTPANLQAVASALDIALTWNESTIGDLPIFYRIREADTLEVVYDGAVNAVTLEDLNPGTIYCYQVQAYNDCGESAWSAQDCALTGCAPPAPPTLVAETSCCGRYHVLTITVNT
jgi:hypothetical protein